MLGQMIEVASECIKHPKQQSMWSYQLGRYICPDDAEDAKAVAEAKRATPTQKPAKATIHTTFKLVFLTAAGGTILFVLMCLGVHLLTGGVMPSATEKFVDGMLDMAKIGFGGIAWWSDAAERSEFGVTVFGRPPGGHASQVY